MVPGAAAGEEWCSELKGYREASEPQVVAIVDDSVFPFCLFI